MWSPSQMVMADNTLTLLKKESAAAFPPVSVLTPVDGVTCRHHWWTVRRVATMVLVAMPVAVGTIRVHARARDPVRIANLGTDVVEMIERALTATQLQ